MFDDAVLKCFLENQLQLYPEPVAETLEEADAFLEDCMAVVVDSVREVWGLKLKFPLRLSLSLTLRLNHVRYIISK